MAENKIKVLYMGKETEEDLGMSEALEMDDYFKPVVLSGHAVDMASKVVPDQYWRKEGLHSWLSARANVAFKKLPVSQHEITWGRLKYVFEYDHQGPVLKTVILV